MNTIQSFTALAVITALLSCRDSENNNNTAGSDNTKCTICPPIPEADVKFANYTINSAEGDTIIYYTGTVIVFPPNSLQDAGGNPVTGDVTVKYREFNSPSEIFLSGIPMEYHFDGETHNFESAGMCQIEAYADNNPLFINSDNKPTVHFSSTAGETDFDVYRFDNTLGTWSKKSKDKIYEPKITAELKADLKEFIPDQAAAIPDEPIKPVKASEASVTLRLKADPIAYPELNMYTNTRFEVLNADRGQVNISSKKTWIDVEIEKGDLPQTYRFTFRNAFETEVLLVRPVLEGKDYDNAMAKYEERFRDYSAVKGERLKRQKEEEERIEKENERIREEIERTNREIRRINMIAEARARYAKSGDESILASYPELTDEERNTIIRQLRKTLIEERMMREFRIDDFGIWNIDRYYTPGNITTFAAKLYDKEGKQLDIKSVNAVYKGVNGVFSYPVNQIKKVNNLEMAIWVVTEDQLYFLTYEDFNSYRIINYSVTNKLIMKSNDLEISSVVKFRNLLNI